MCIINCLLIAVFVINTVHTGCFLVTFNNLGGEYIGHIEQLLQWDQPRNREIKLTLSYKISKSESD